MALGRAAHQHGSLLLSNLPNSPFTARLSLSDPDGTGNPSFRATLAGG